MQVPAGFSTRPTEMDPASTLARLAETLSRFFRARGGGAPRRQAASSGQEGDVESYLPADFRRNLQVTCRL